MKRKGFGKDDRGITYTEFGLIGVLLSIAAVFFLTDIGHDVVETYTDVSETQTLKEM